MPFNTFLIPGSLPIPSEEWEQRLLQMHGAVDSPTFIKSVFSLLEGTVSCAWSLANLRNVELLPVLAQDSRGREYDVKLMDELMTINPAVPILIANPGLRVLPTRDNLPPDTELRQHPFYQRCMGPFGWRHGVTLFFWQMTPPVPHTVFTVFRTEDQPDFNEEEIDRLRAIHPHIGTTLKRIRFQLDRQALHQGANDLFERLPSGAMLANWDLTLSSETPATAALRAEWPDCQPGTLPPLIQSACAQLKSLWNETMRIGPEGKVVKRQNVLHPTDAHCYAEVSIIHQQDSVLAHPSFVIQFHRISAQKHFGILTDAERAVVLPLCQGLDNATIAERTGLTLSAVKSRLFSAFKKLRIEHRSQLLALLNQPPATQAPANL